MKLTLLAAQIVIAVLLVLAGPGLAAERRHGLSAFGDLKYPPNFTHFDYVNPEAPKGGRISVIGTAALITFDSFNGYILKGDSAQGIGTTYAGLTVFDQLMVRAWDEPDAVYGLVAREVELSDDRRSVTFFLRPEARFADGTQLTAEDVIHSFELLKKDGHPQIAQPLRDVERAEAIDPATVRYWLVENAPRDLPLFVAQLPVFSKAFYSVHDFTATSLVPPLGSGPYMISDFKAGRYVRYKRRPDYWAADLPVSRGKYNFDEIQFEYFRDRTIELEALKSGEFDLREEFTSRDWATGYDVAAVREGRLILKTIPDERPSGAQGFFINTRRDRFSDIRIRKALDLAFDYEWTNKNLFYSLYTRTNSYFENSVFKAEGAPTPEELAVLEPFRDKLAPEVFEEVYVSPVTDGSGQDRKLLREARELLRAAGWTVRQEELALPADCGLFCRASYWIGWSSRDTEEVLRNESGDRFPLEFLIFSPTFERVIAPYVKNLKLLGIDASIRKVDPAQYQRRLKSFDFDVIVSRFVMNTTPGPEIRPFFSSSAATSEGSFNLAGIADPVVDALMDKAVVANSREALITTMRALDRVLRAGHYWVPQWNKAAHNLAFWDKFSWPPVKPRYSRGVLETWWFDEDKAGRLAKGQ